MRTATVLTSILVVVPSLASAEGADAPAVPEYFDLIASPPTDTHMTFVRQLLPPAGPNAIAAVAQSRVIYLNKGGVTLAPGDNDARTNRSWLVNSTRAVPAWTASAATWNGVMTCFRDMFSRWDVTITDVDPGIVPHVEAVFTPSPSSIGMSAGTGGVSPFTEDCGIIENSIVFTFTNGFNNNAQKLCEVMAQEVAHSYGLDHELLASDPMTYLNFTGKRTFKDQTASCGESQARPCGIGGSTCRANQNSVQLLDARLGTADVIAPTIGITAPADGATVQPGFNVEAMASDNVGVANATLLIDDAVVTMTAGAGPYVFLTDAMLAEGPHAISVEVTDGKNPQRQTIHVTIAKTGGGSGSGGDSGSDSGSGSGGDSDGDGVPDGGDDGAGGGCSSGRDVGFAFGLFVLAHMMIRRRRYV